MAFGRWETQRAVVAIEIPKSRRMTPEEGLSAVEVQQLTGVSAVVCNLLRSTRDQILQQRLESCNLW